MSERARQIDPRVADLDGPAALPRKNGELVFEAPWQGRAFGMAVVLNQAGRYGWNEFRGRLVEQIGGGDPSAAHYYERWLAAFERLVVEKQLIRPEELAARAAEFKSGERDEVF